MNRSIKAFFETHFPFNKMGLDELINSFQDVHFPKGKIILQPNRIENELTFISSGIIREYYSTDSKEININFYSEMEFSSDLYSFYTRTKTKKWQECITDISAKSLTYENFGSLLEKFGCGKDIVAKSMEKLIKRKEKLEFIRTTKNTEELYKEILIKKPNWLKHIPQYQLASFLNVTPETLSRIRNRIS